MKIEDLGNVKSADEMPDEMRDYINSLGDNYEFSPLDFSRTRYYHKGLSLPYPKVYLYYPLLELQSDPSEYNILKCLWLLIRQEKENVIKYLDTELNQWKMLIDVMRFLPLSKRNKWHKLIEIMTLMFVEINGIHKDDDWVQRGMLTFQRRAEDPEVTPLGIIEYKDGILGVAQKLGKTPAEINEMYVPQYAAILHGTDAFTAEEQHYYDNISENHTG